MDRPVYVLDPIEDEVARLLSYAEREAEQVRLACRQVGLASGARAIDVGCGPLGALKFLAETVGESGVTVGIDQSRDTLAIARRVLDQIGLQRVVLVEGDIHSLERPGWARSFDVAYCRLVLLHQRAPLETLEHIARLIRPGGHVVYQDILDEPSFPRSDPDVPEAHRAWEVLFALFRRKGVSPGVARDHGSLCRRLGWTLVAQRGKFAVSTAQEGLGILLRLLAASERSILDEALDTRVGLASLTSSLERAKSSDYRYWFGPLAIETVACLP